nr:MAG TPA: hypothetical protein [Caudoviricetes sp.]
MQSQIFIIQVLRLVDFTILEKILVLNRLSVARLPKQLNSMA